MIESLKGAEWLKAKSLNAVFDALEAAGGEVRVNGGAVRNALMGIPIGDIDLSTTLLPEQTAEALEAAGIKAIPTGIEHGTVTAISQKTPFEITTLREDIETDGRHAVVKFGTDWELDAKRRDLTMNALYCDRYGEVFDPLNGLPDLENRIVRFIGDAEERIAEDHLRIMRFFRFFAWYGSGRPDAAGLKACAKLRSGLEKISAERIWMELKKILSAKDPSRGLLWMRTTGVLNLILPESEKWGIDLVPHLIVAENKWRWKPDAMLLLMAMVRPDGENVIKLARRMKLSNAETERLTSWAMCLMPKPDISATEFAKLLYLGDPQSMIDCLKLELARMVSNQNGESSDAKAHVQLVKTASKWKRPILPVKGQDLLDKGYKAGPEMGGVLKQLETKWVESGFKLGRKSLIESV
ncbi:MAG: CCA tRNA nucleotidyltransferase [Salaquimonas sp.]